MSLCSRKANIFLDGFGRFASDIELETDFVLTWDLYSGCNYISTLKFKFKFFLKTDILLSPRLIRG